MKRRIAIHDSKGSKTRVEPTPKIDGTGKKNIYKVSSLKKNGNFVNFR